MAPAGVPFGVLRVEAATVDIVDVSTGQTVGRAVRCALRQIISNGYWSPVSCLFQWCQSCGFIWIGRSWYLGDCSGATPGPSAAPGCQLAPLRRGRLSLQFYVIAQAGERERERERLWSLRVIGGRYSSCIMADKSVGKVVQSSTEILENEGSQSV